MDIAAELKLARLPRHRKMLASRARMRVHNNLPEGVKRAAFRGSGRHYCPVCESRVGGFLTFGHIPKCWCPVCASMNRHRLAWTFFRERTNLFDGAPKSMLHVAPEVAFEPRFRRIPGLDYITADLYDPNVRVKMDVTDIRQPDGSYDIVYCSHVLEHVPDDRRAMRELHRVLRPGGWAAFMVPTRPDRETDEDPSIADPAERERRFGQHDHVRFYNDRDFAERLREAGFRVEVVRAAELVGPDRAGEQGLIPEEPIYHCRKDA